MDIATEICFYFGCLHYFSHIVTFVQHLYSPSVLVPVSLRPLLLLKSPVCSDWSALTGLNSLILTWCFDIYSIYIAPRPGSNRLEQLQQHWVQQEMISSAKEVQKCCLFSCQCIDWPAEAGIPACCSAGDMCESVRTTRSVQVAAAVSVDDRSELYSAP